MDPKKGGVAEAAKQSAVLMKKKILIFTYYALIVPKKDMRLLTLLVNMDLVSRLLRR